MLHFRLHLGTHPFDGLLFTLQLLFRFESDKIEGFECFELDRLDQLGKEVVALFLVFDERIFLIVAPQTDTRFENVHLIEMIPPGIVEDL